MYKKLFLILILTFTLIYAKNVNASVTNVRLYDSNYTLISGLSGNCASYDINYPRDNVRYIRFVLDDAYQPNKSYNATFNFSISSFDDYAWLGWNGASGFNIGGIYVSTSPDSARTNSQSVIIGPPNVYQKSSTTLFTFTTGTSVSQSFFQLDLQVPRTILRACMDNYSIILDSSSNQDSQNIINNNNMNTGSIISNQNNNTQDIINNNNTNTQNIINNQNSNTDKEINSQKVCKLIDKSSIYESNKYLTPTGSTSTSSTGWGITNYFSIPTGSTIAVVEPYTTSTAASMCFYNGDKQLISCIMSDNSISGNIIIPSSAQFVRFSIDKNLNRPSFKLCTNGNQALSDNMQDLNNTLTDSDIDISGQIIDAPTTSHPISSLVTAPISFLQSLDDTCTPISFTLGFPGTTINTITLPCGDTIFWNRTDLNYVQEFRLFWNVLFGGALLYFFGIKLFKTFEKALDPFETGINDLEV